VATCDGSSPEVSRCTVVPAEVVGAHLPFIYPRASSYVAVGHIFPTYLLPVPLPSCV